MTAILRWESISHDFVKTIMDAFLDSGLVYDENFVASRFVNVDKYMLVSYQLMGKPPSLVISISFLHKCCWIMNVFLVSWNSWMVTMLDQELWVAEIWWVPLYTQRPQEKWKPSPKRMTTLSNQSEYVYLHAYLL